MTTVALTEKQQTQRDSTMVDEDDTQDPAEDEQQLGRVKKWISSYHLDKVQLTDILANFPDISVVLIEDIAEKLVHEGTLSKADTDSYIINKQKKFDYEFDAVKEEMDCQVVPNRNKVPHNSSEHYMYMKALHHALPMNYITVAKLQNKLEGEANQTTVRKLIDKMTQDGFLDARSSRRLGKRVIHSDITEKKLIEVKKALESYAMDVDMNESVNEPNGLEFQAKEKNNHKDLSTCGGLHSIGSELTRTRGRSDTNQNRSTGSEQTVSRKREHGNTPTSRAEPVASGESFVPGVENGRLNGKSSLTDDFDAIICSRSSQQKRSRKASTVKEPIHQYMKRQKSQAP